MTRPGDRAERTEIAIADLRPADPGGWDRTWNACPYSTYFHSRAWADLWAAYTDGDMRPAPVQITFSDGKEAIIPLSCRRGGRGLVRHYSSSPGGTFGGWLSSDDLDVRHRTLLGRTLISRFRDVTWRLNPYDVDDLPDDIGPRTPDETRTLALDDEFAVIVRRSSKGHRSAASKARREGVEVSVAQTQDDWLSFAELYGDSVRRWGDRATSVYDARLFELLRHRSGPDVQLWLARHDGVAVAGALCLYAPRHVAYWLGGASEAYFPLRPVHLLVYEAIEDACRRRLAWFDFNPSGGHEGVAAFKKGFGTVLLPAPVIVATGRLSSGIDRARNLLPRPR